MAAITSAVIAIVGVVLGWITIEIACKSCLEKGREAIDQSLNPDYDADADDDDDIRAPLNSNLDPVEYGNPKVDSDSSISAKAV
ncbi:hypothetical protein SLE2022_305960 [Rubroshorea leprosula]